MVKWAEDELGRNVDSAVTNYSSTITLAMDSSLAAGAVAVFTNITTTSSIIGLQLAKRLGRKEKDHRYPLHSGTKYQHS